ncbi:ubiquitin-protein ligase E3C [Cydia fagiglandana]|uniref:ubiquitin-protein ligase E3C n=1 Tax=Cydia fagiglandana TaxID=1458189 RepID=UPI002FEE4369
MYSFEGDFRRKPQQNLSGASAQRKTNRDALILQTQQQRQKREEHRKRLNSTIKIQAYVRSYLTRKHCKQSEREEFDNIFPKVNADDIDLLCALVVKILFFYDGKVDSSRLVSVSQLLLKQWRKVFQNGGCYIQIRRLLVLHLRLLKDGSEVPLAVPLRMFEVFTSVNSAENSMNSDEVLSNVAGTFLYLVKRGYFAELRELLCRKTPPLYGPSPNPPTPLCGALLDLIQRPLNLTTHVDISGYDNMVMSEFASAFLCNPYPEPVEMYIIPALSVDSRKFPFLSLVQCLRDETIFNKRVLNDSWLLHSVLSLEPPGFANEIRNINNTRLPNNPIVLDYLKIIAQLTVNVCNKQITYEYEDSLYSQETAADKDDDSDSETEPNPTSVREQMLLTRCIEILNEPDRCVMATCSQITESDLSEDFLDCLSKICHNLLLSHRMALHKYRLLYTLAFKPIFLRGLWHWLSHMSHESSFGGSATPLLSALSRGMGADSSVLGVHRLLAPLAVFCALFSLLIGTLHDTEFCRDVDDDDSMSCDSIFNNDISVSHLPTGGGGRVHAFEFSELGGLCRTLRQVCLGLVELAYPESRPAVNTQYRDAVGAPIELAGSQTPAWSHLFKVCTHLLRALYVRDSRLCFMAAGSWPVRGCVPEGAAAVLVVAGTHVRPNPRQLRRPQHLHHARDQGQYSEGERQTSVVTWPVRGCVPEGAAAVLVVAGTHVRPNPRQLRRPQHLHHARDQGQYSEGERQTSVVTWPVRGCVPEGAAAVLVVAGTHVRPNPRQLRRPQHLHHARDQGQYSEGERQTSVVTWPVRGCVPEGAAAVLVVAGTHVRPNPRQLRRPQHLHHARDQGQYSEGERQTSVVTWPVRGCVPEGAAAVLVVAGTHVRPNPRQLRRPQHLHHARDQDEGPPLTIKELRTVTILREIPFVVPFSTRVLIFQGLLVREKHDHWYEMSNFNEGPSINISVRRTHLYEDAFDKLSPDNEPDMKLKLRVQLINQAGAEEAGVDGGGLFREFLSELLKSAFDPNRGLFRLTKDNMLYPNPGVHLLYDDFPMHYYFVGRMLGKALYENLLVELPLAEFFLGKLCSSREPDVHALASLDPALYRGLLMLKSHRRQDVPDLGLDFTIVSDELGEQRIEELKPGGSNIPVTSENRIEYIHLVADYKLNRQIRSQCNAFKRGLTSVVNAEWLRMFSCRELQLLISGAEVPIDLDDLRAHTQYAGGFSATHPTVQWFWKVVENFADAQRRQLLKFVTSCSRPPLLGFKDLQPPFCIQSAGASDRLPSSSTCMNLLKLPEFHSEQQLHEKLLYAIQAGAGFELS